MAIERCLQLERNSTRSATSVGFKGWKSAGRPEFPAKSGIFRSRRPVRIVRGKVTGRRCPGLLRLPADLDPIGDRFDLRLGQRPALLPREPGHRRSWAAFGHEFQEDRIGNDRQEQRVVQWRCGAELAVGAVATRAILAVECVDSRGLLHPAPRQTSSNRLEWVNRCRRVNCHLPPARRRSRRDSPIGSPRPRCIVFPTSRLRWPRSRRRRIVRRRTRASRPASEATG